jgi:hypothetical protein
MLGSARYPALDAWREEIRAGERSAIQFDELWQAACCEQWAADLLAWGQPHIALAVREDAKRIIFAAARQQRDELGPP